MATMLAARYLGPNRIEPVEVPVPSIGSGEALIKVDACGFCGSDLAIVAGLHPRAKAPLTLGHELSGRVVEINSADTRLAVGDLVTLYPLISCGHCYVCRTGNPHVCRNLKLYGFDADGGMAEYVKLPVDNLLKLPDDMATLCGALLEPLAVAVHGVSRAPLADVRTVVVIGAGPIGLLTALVAVARGVPNLLITDISPSRLELAAKLGLHTAMAGAEARELVLQETDEEGVDLVFECAGAPASAEEMTRLLRPQGTIVNLGVFKGPVKVQMRDVNFKELTIIGSRVYAKKNFEEAVRLAAVLPLRDIVTHSFPLLDVETAFDSFRQGEGVCKVIVYPGTSGV